MRQKAEESHTNSFFLYYGSVAVALVDNIKQMFNPSHLMWVTASMSLTKHFLVRHGFEWQSYLNPFVLGGYDSPGPATCAAPEG